MPDVWAMAPGRAFSEGAAMNWIDWAVVIVSLFVLIFVVYVRLFVLLPTWMLWQLPV